MNRRAVLAVFAAALAALAAAAPTAAAPGELDTTFSGDGWLSTAEVSTGSNTYRPKGAEDIAIQSDGKIVAVGRLEDSVSNWYFTVFRYMPNGALDPSFGKGGWVAADFGAADFAHAVAVQGDGKIVVAGEAPCPPSMTTCFTLVRYDTAGNLDKSFGGDGVVQTMFSRCGCFANDVALKPSGKIVAVGWRFQGGDDQDDDIFAIAQYLPDGRLDTTFSRDGRASLDFGLGDDVAHAVDVQSDGKILVVGQGSKDWHLTEDDFAFARFRLDGTLDPTFSGDGLRTINFGSTRFDIGRSVDIQDDGRILAAGGSTVDLYSSPRMAVLRLNANGTLDGTFHGDGRRLTMPVRYGGSAHAVLQHPDGRIVMAGRGYEDSTHEPSDWVLVRYTRGGALDTSFGGDGIVVNSFGTGADWADALAVQQDGKIVAGGAIYTRQSLARYLAR